MRYFKAARMVIYTYLLIWLTDGNVRGGRTTVEGDDDRQNKDDDKDTSQYT